MRLACMGDLDALWMTSEFGDVSMHTQGSMSNHALHVDSQFNTETCAKVLFALED